MGFFSALFLILLVLKLTNLIALSWVAVFLWPIAGIVIAFLLMVIWAGILSRL